MHVYRQNELMRQALAAAAAEVQAMRQSVSRKCAAPYPDGSHSVMVNAASDVIPRLVDIERMLADALAEVTA